MQTDSESFELIIILALVAVFILFQLRRTLGKKTGYDPSRDQKDTTRARRPQSDEDADDIEDGNNVYPLDPDMDISTAHLGLSRDAPFYKVIEQMNRLDSSFTLRSFFDGAEQAYGLILEAFWTRDSTRLRTMLSRQVFEQFDHVIRQNKEKGLHQDNRLMDIEKIDLVEATLSGSMAELTVGFNSHMILTTRNETGDVVEGDSTKPVTIRDIWTFCRDLKSRDPNWTLVATRTG